MNTKRNWILLSVFSLIAFILVHWYANYKSDSKTYIEPTVDVDIQQIKERGVLRVIMEYNSISYFIYRGQRFGFEYELMQEFAKSLGVKLEIVVARSSDDQFNLLNEGKGDIIANGLLSNEKIKQKASFTLPYRNVEQVIVQRKTGRYLHAADSTYRNDTTINSTTELSDKIVYVAENSIYYDKLKELSNTLGINIDVRILSDDRGTEDIIEAVANNEIDFTIANKDIALLNKSYFENLDVSTSIGVAENLRWAVRNNSPQLLTYINNWITSSLKEKLYATLYDRYFNQQKNIQFGFDEENAMYQQGGISHYDAIIQKYAKKINWDWRLVAAIIHQESKFNPNARSWCGAQGLMQLMPGTARDLGVYGAEVYQPDRNVRAGTDYLKQLEKQWSNVSDFTQRIKFILASYNAGPGHVSDAARLAAKYGYRSDKWDGNVEYFMLYKSNPKFYNDNVCKYGYCRGQEPFNYVRRIVKKYFEFETKVNLTAENQIPADQKLAQVETEAFVGVEGVYNPTQGLVSRSAKRELFLSHKLFEDGNQLIPRTDKSSFGKNKQELFAEKDKSDTAKGKQLFQKKGTLFAPPNNNPTSGRLEPVQGYEINKLKLRKK